VLRYGRRVGRYSQSIGLRKLIGTAAVTLETLRQVVGDVAHRFGVTLQVPARAASVLSVSAGGSPHRPPYPTLAVMNPAAVEIQEVFLAIGIEKAES